MPTYNARVAYTASGGETSFAFSFPYITASHVKLYINGTVDASAVVTGDPSSGGTIAPSGTISASDAVIVVRETSRTSRLVDYSNASVLDENTLDTDSLQAFYMTQEGLDVAALAETTAGAVTTVVTTAEAAAGAAQAAAETAQAGAETAETNAAASAAAAAVSETNAAASETAAAASASAAAAVVSGMMTFQGTFDASGGSLPANSTDTDFWYVSVGGTAGGFTFVAGDMLIYSSSTYYKIDNTEPDALFRDGSLAMTGNLDMGGYDVTNAGDVVASGTGVAAQGMPLVTETATTRTLAVADVGAYIRCTHASGCTVTIPTNASVAIPIGAEFVVFNASGGTVTIAGAGITKFQVGANIADQGGAATLKKVATDTWDITGALS